VLQSHSQLVHFCGTSITIRERDSFSQCLACTVYSSYTRTSGGRIHTRLFYAEDPVLNWLENLMNMAYRSDALSFAFGLTVTVRVTSFFLLPHILGNALLLTKVRCISSVIIHYYR